MIKKGIYAASLSVLNNDKTLNVDLTIKHAVNTIKSGLHGVFFLVQQDKVNLFLLQKKKN